MDIVDKLYTSSEVAKLLGVSLRSIYRYLESGKLKSTQIATGRHRYSKENIEEFLNPVKKSSAKNEVADKSDLEKFKKNNIIVDTPWVEAGARGVPISIREKEEEVLESGPKIHYFRSPVNDLKTIAKTIKKSSQISSIPYAFTLFAGASLHHPIKPFTILHLYVDSSDMEFFKKRLLLGDSEKEKANVSLLESQSQAVFDASYEKGGYMVVSDERLYGDLSEYGEMELARGLKETTGL